MCAIFGIIGDYEEQLAKKAFATLAHRGEDSCSITQKTNLFFAHHRLAITPSTTLQPYSHQHLLISFNGEIYNYKELAEELKESFSFVYQDEVEVITAAYLFWGVDFVCHLRGMFAIAILDKDTLHLFRDPSGKKPLFYLKTTKSFIFASEIKALIPFLQKKEMDNDAFLSYLSFLAPTPPFTFFKNIYKLAAGEHLLFEHEAIQTRLFFDILDTPSSLICDKDEAIFLLKQAINKSVKTRLHHNAAALLSGGIDSAAIAAYAKKNSLSLHTYTIGYKEFSKYDERENAKESAKLLGVTNQELEISQDEFLGALDATLSTLDEPLNDPAAIPLYLLFKQIKKDGYRVVLSGEGSDELFLGYRQYFEFLDIEQLAKLNHKRWLSNYFHSNYSQNREWERYKRVFDETLLYRTMGESFTDLQKNVALRRNVRDNESLKYLKTYRDRFLASSHADESIWYSFIDLQLFQGEHFLTKLDRVSMAHGIEARAPFLDQELMELVFSIDPKLRYQDAVTKSLLKETLHGVVDEKILNRRKKGFSNPYLEYIISSGRIDIIKEVNDKTGLFKSDVLDAHLKQALQGGFKQHIWGLFVLSEWIKKHLL